MVRAVDHHPCRQRHGSLLLAILHCHHADLDQVGDAPERLLRVVALLASLSLLSLSSLLSSTGAVLAGQRTVAVTSHGGRSRLIAVEGCESSRDFADQLMRLCANAFGPNGFLRLEVAEALGATFLAPLYMGSGGSGGGGQQEQLSSSWLTAFAHDQHKRMLLKQYLKSMRGLDDDVRSRAPSSSLLLATSVAAAATVGFRDILIKIKRLRFYSQQE